MKKVVGLLLLLFVCSSVSLAQVAGTAAVQGTVEDATGAVVPNASVSITNTATGVSQTTKTDASGFYSFPSLIVGPYEVAISAPGFEAYKKTGIVLEVGSSIAVDAKLQVGAASQTVQVEAQGLALQTEDSSFKQTIDQTDLTEMPLNGRSMTALITTSGASTTAPGGDFTGSKYSYAAVSVSVAGGMGNTTEWKLDGGTNNDYMANSNLPFPFPDAVNEFSVESTDLGAATGNHTGGLVNVVTRSGTDQFHGDGFEFIRNNLVDSTNYFATGKDQLHQNEYGGTIGGPIVKNKLFFFTGFQREVSKQLSSTTSAYIPTGYVAGGGTPTTGNLAGDFSVTDPPIGSAANVCGDKAVQLYDPVTGAALPGNKYNQPGGPVLPAWNSASLALMAYLPPLKALPDGSDACGHVQYGIPNDFYDKQSITRIDYTINSRNTLYGHYFLDGYQLPAQYSPTNILLTTANGNVERTQSITLGEDFVVNPNVVNSVHFTFLRRRNDRGYSDADINAAKLGVNVYQLYPHGLQLTLSTSGSNHKFTIGGGTNSHAAFNDNTWDAADNLNWNHGKHQFVLGGELIHNQLNIDNVYEGNGTFTFNGEYSGVGGPAGGSAVGDANLDFLAGALQAFQQSKAQQNALRGNIPSLYFQDTYHASTRLTLVGGIRWTPTYFPVDYFNRGIDWNMTGFLDNAISSVYPNAPPGITFYGDPRVKRQFTTNSPDQWSPNVGFTFDPVGDGKTVFRAGFQFAYDQPNYFTSQRNQQNPPYATASGPSTTSQLCFSNPWLVGGTGYGCYQTGGDTSDDTYPSAQVPTPATAVFPAQSQYIATASNFRPTDTGMWTASIQHEFGRGWQVQAQYIGNRSSHDPNGYPIDDAVFVPGEWQVGPGGPTANAIGCPGFVTTGPAAVKPPKNSALPQNCSTTGNYISRFALTVDNPVGNGVNGGGNQIVGGGAGSVLINSVAWSDYNGLVLSVQHRLSSSFTLLGNYTWSKCLDVEDAAGDLSGNALQNPNNLRGDYGPCGQDLRNVFNASVVATSSVKRFDRAVNSILSDWEVAPLIRVNNGFPINVTTGTDLSLIDVNKDRPDRVAGVPVYLPSHLFINSATEADEGYLNPAAFVTPPTLAGCTSLTGCSALNTFGTLGKNAFPGPNQFQFDAEISRYFPIHENVKLDFRLEAYNVLNHPVFANPNAAFSSNGLTAGGSFGLISGTTGEGARVFQGALKLIF
ncbi:MAG TPA: carboxypeptidase-like regulatory domain-containing protein [Candidatus Aquilonibacter sp.]|nr:carboxypeptidase-like regulatory domain-containing protein [Candidatus Aquilonibacter sp.]